MDPATVRAIAEHDAAFVGANVLYLKGGTKDHFMRFLREEFPHLVAGYERLYPGAYAPKPYTEAVRTLVHSLQERYDLRRRRRGLQEATADDADEGETAEAEADEPSAQASFEW